MKRSLVLASLFLAPSTAVAGDYMWGGGVLLGTMAWPTAYPSYFPPAVGDETSIEQADSDAHFGLEGVYYLDGQNRIGASLVFARGKPDFRDRAVTFKYGQMQNAGSLDILIGGGVGIGQSTWEGEGEESLVVTHYPIRAEVGPMYRNGSIAGQFLIYGQYNLQGAHVLTGANGQDLDVGTGLYMQFGVEAHFYLGDFTPPKNKDKGKGKGKGKDKGKDKGGKGGKKAV